MRIISGKYKGRRISPPKNLPVRPTTDMCKEALFNILNNNFNFSGLRILDLFAGTGSISYEFGSRGCSPITSVDGDMGCVMFIKKTAQEFDFDITAIKSDVFKFLEKSKASYDIIFADPPYDMKGIGEFPGVILQANILNENGFFVLEHISTLNFSSLPGFSESRNYGQSMFSFFNPGS